MKRVRTLGVAVLAVLALVVVPAPGAHADVPSVGRIGYLEGDQLYVEEGDLDGDPAHQDATVERFQLENDRIAVLTPR